MFEADLHALLVAQVPAVSGRVHPDTAPDVPVFPYISYQQVGGNSLWFGERKMPDHKNARMQFNVWAKTRAEANSIARAVEKAICEGPFPSEPLGALVALYDDPLKLYGTRQDFGLWYPDP